MKNYLGILALALAMYGIHVSLAPVSIYNNHCSLCIYEGYNYCNDNKTCVDNRPSYCVNIFDKSTKCTKIICNPITIIDKDWFTQKEAAFYLSKDQYCILTVNHALSDVNASSYFLVLINENTTLKFNKTTSLTPTYYTDFTDYY